MKSIHQSSAASYTGLTCQSTATINNKSAQQNKKPALFMRWIFALFALPLLLLTAETKAQLVANYSFAASSGTYTALVTPTNAFPTGWDDETPVSVPIGFSFNFNGTAYTSVFVNANGFISFGATSTAGSPYTPISSSDGYAGTVAAFGRDLQAQPAATLGSIDYKTTGGVFTVQWSNARRYNSTTANAERFDFQIQLVQTTNVINIVYGTFANAVSAATTNNAQIGLRGTANTDFKNLAVASGGSWASPTAGGANTAICFYNQTSTATKPASGQTYTFTPPPPCVAPTTIAASVTTTPATSTVAGSFTAAPPTVPTGYLVVRTATNSQPTPVTGTTYTVGSNAIGFIEYVNATAGVWTSTGLTPSTQYFYWVFSYNNTLCAGGPVYSATAATPAIQPTTLAAQTYTWNQTGSASFALNTNWSPSRTVLDVTDILIVDGALTPTPTITGLTSQTVSQFKLQNNAVVALQSSAAATLTMGGAAGTDLDIPSGSTLNLNGGSTIGLAFSGSGNTASVAGTLSYATTAGTPVLNLTNCITTVTGTVNFSSATNPVTLTGVTATSLLMNAGSTMNSTTVQTTIPLATWAATSNLNISNPTSSTFSNTAQTFGNFTYNSSGLSATNSFFTSGTAAVQGDLNIQGTATGRLRLLTTGTLTVGGNINVSNAAAFDLMNGAASLTVTGSVNMSGTSTGNFTNGAGTINIGGSVSVSGGAAVTFGNAGGANTTNITGNLNLNSTATSVLSLTSGTTQIINVAGNFSQTAGTFNIATGSGAGTLKVAGSFSQTGGTIANTGTGNPTIEFNGLVSQSVSFASAVTGIINTRINNNTGISLTGTIAINTGAALIISSTAAIPISGGTLTYTGTTTLTYNSTTGAQTITANEFPAAAGPTNLTINNTAVSPNNVVTLPLTRTVAGTLAMTAGNINLSSNALTIGTSAASTGTLTYTAGLIQVTTGSLTRYFGTTGLPTTTGGTAIGFYPLGFGTNNRTVNVYFSTSTALSTGGSITVSPVDAAGVTPQNFLDVAYQVDKRTNASWTISQSGLVATGTISLRISGGNLSALAATSIANTTLRLIQNGAAAGTFVASSYSAPNFRVDRTGLTVAQIGNTHYIGGSNSDIPTLFTAIASTDWSLGTTWDQGSAPGAGDAALIPNGFNVTTDAAAANVCGSLSVATGGTLTSNTATLTVNGAYTNNGTLALGGGTVTTTGAFTNGGTVTAASGTLNVGTNIVNNAASVFTASGATINVTGTVSNAGTVSATAGTVSVTAASTTGITNTATFTLNGATINLSAAGNNTRTFANNSGGILSVISGNLNIFGNFVTASGSTFNQSGGNITVDGNNNGNAATSVASGTVLVNIASPTGTVTGGTLTIVDPPAIGTARSFEMNWTSGTLQWAAAHTLSFGNGVSTDASATTTGFSFDTYVGSTGTQAMIGSLVVAGGNATNRWATTTSASANGSFVKGNITINSGSELRDIASGGALVLAGSLTNNGTLSMTSAPFRLATFTGSVEGATANAQTIAGTGLFRNSTTTPTANLVNLTINNSNVAGLTLSGIDLSFSGAITFTLGNINTGANKIILIAGGSTTGAANATGFIQGNLQRNFTTGSSSRVFDIGSSNRYAPVTLNFASVTAAGDITMTTITGDHPNLATSGLRNDLSINRYWVPTNAGVLFTAYTLTLGYRGGDADPGVTVANLKIGKYTGGTWSLPTVSGTPTATVITSAAGITSLGEYAVAEACPVANAGTVSGTSPLCIGQTATYSSNGDAGGTWTSTDPTKATVDINSGLVTAVAAGTTDITYHITRPGGCAEVTAFKTLTVSPDYTITASAGANGSISPNGVTTVCSGGGQLYTITPDACYSVSDVTLNGVSQGAVTSLNVTNVTSNTTVIASFVLSTYTITVTAGTGGSITPGTGSHNCGDNATYTITPDACHTIADVVVDGVSQGAVGTYTFTNITAAHTISASFNVIPYTITVTAGANGSITPATGSVNCGSNATYTITANACYSIADVVVDGVSQGAVGTYTFTNVTANHTISATFVLNTYTITVTAGANGSITPATGSVNCGDNATYTITADPGYSIADVVVDGVSQGAVGTYTFTNVTANHTISTTFAINGYTITSSAGANGSISPLGATSVNAGANQSYTIIPDACYSIADVLVDGVSVGAVGTYTFTNVTANHTISATFVLNTYTITVTAGANGSITPATGSVNCGDNAAYTITPDACYSIADVVVDGVSQGAVGTYTFTNVTANHTISATFTETNYTITVTAGANGSITPATGSVNCGDNATYTITPDACYAIADVVVDGVSQGAVGTYTFTNVTANHTISATFSLNTYTITVTAGANGSITPATGSVNCGDNATYTITADACYSIADVVVDGVSQGAVGTYTFTNVTANHTISATFSLNTYTITVTAGANGSITPATGSVNCGDNATYTITADACYSIADVVVDGVTQGAVGTYTFTNVTANHTISATFSLNTYTITVTAGANGSITPATGTVNCGDNATYTITPDACYAIADVVVDGVSQGAVGTYTFTNVTANHTISATFSLNTYTITVTAGANGSITPATGSVNCGDNATYTITPDACYAITDVVVDGVSQGAVGTYTFTNVTANHTISATFVLNTYTITVTAGANGSITPATGTVNCGDNATYTITPDACYAITDVVVDGVSQGAVGTYTFTNVTANHTISATFVATTYTITVTAGANGSITPATGSVNCGDNATYTITPDACYAIADVVVDGVSQGAVGTYTFTNVTANHTISATFVATTYTITVTAGANGSITPATGSVNCGDNATYTITPDACYAIADVVVDGVSQGAVGTYTFTNVTANHTISATFVATTYTITVTAGANGSITPATGSVNCGDNATYTITPDACYAIADVVVDGVSQGAVGTYTFTNVTANHTISATFVATTYTITVTAGANGSITPATGSVNCGDNATYTITPDACYSITDVVVDGVSQGAVGTYTFTNVTANHTISATFVLNTYTITVTAGANGSITPATGTVNCGDNATYTITADACYTITDVVVDGVSQGAVGTYTFTNVTANHTISATFTFNTYTITVTAGANGSITPATGSVNCGDNATYTITPDACYAITDVVVDGVSQGAVGTYTFTNVTANHTISATFSLNTYTITVTAGANGSITPATGSVNCGDNATYTITPDACYVINEVVVDGVSAGTVGTYTFTNVTANHTISASFVLATYLITVTPGANGSITPSSGMKNCGDNATYTITPDACYAITDVVVDGVSQGAVGTYTFTNVTANHTISATFSLNTYTITVTAGANGSITPATGTVNCGDNATYTITADACYSITDVVVDGVSQGAVGTYTFTNVTANHTISATFTLNTYTITVTSGANGSITPATGSVNCGDNATYTITADGGYTIADVVVDGVSQGAVGTYTFTNVTANHTISATFVNNASFIITSSAGANGSISPNGATSVASGGSQAYTITAIACYHVADVLVDGVSVGAVTTYTFTNVTANHTISATFAINAPLSVSVSGPVNVCPYIGTGDQITYTATSVGATGFTWVIPPTNVTIISGQGTASLTVSFQNGFQSQANKQLRVTATSACGNSPLFVYYLVVQIPSTPQPIVGTTSVCAVIGTAGTLTYTIPSVPGASSYNWVAQLGTTTITHPNGLGVNDTTVNVSFTNGFTASSLTVSASNQGCGTSGVRSLALTRNNPSQPGLISGPTNACAYIAPGGTVAAYSIVPVAGASSYTWTVPAGAIGVSPQGSTSISFTYPNSFVSGTVSVTATNGCGTGAARTLSISRLTPSTPSVIDVIQTSPCPNRVYTYTLSGMPANATSVQWTIPAGATLVSGQGTVSITVSYPGTAVNGAVTAQGISNCGSSTIRSTTVKLPACPELKQAVYTKGGTTPATTRVAAESMQVNVFPNPTVSDFKLQVITAGKQVINVRIMDAQGRSIKQLLVMPSQTVNIGADLKAGAYIMEVRQGDNVKTTKLLKF